MQEGFSSEHRCEFLCDIFEYCLHCCVIANHWGSFRVSRKGSIAVGGLDVIWNPFEEVRWIFVEYLFTFLFNGISWKITSETSRSSHVSTVRRVGWAHEGREIEQLVHHCRLIDFFSLIDLVSKRSHRVHEEMQPREGNQTDGLFTDWCVDLTWKTHTTGVAGYDSC